MDNGKKAQGAMEKYWRQQKTREKTKEHGRPTEQKDEEVDMTKVSYEKWKHHQMDMQMGKYGNQQEKEEQKPA